MIMFCPKCGKENADDVKFCSNCGQNLAEGERVYEGVDIEGAEATPQKSALAAGLLGILLGSLGIHNFYLGYTGKAIVQLVLTVTLVLSFVSAIWGLIEGIMILTGSINVDGNGNKIKKDF